MVSASVTKKTGPPWPWFTDICIHNLWLHAGEKPLHKPTPTITACLHFAQCILWLTRKMSPWTQPLHFSFATHTRPQLTLTLMLSYLCWSLSDCYLCPVLSPASAAGGSGHGTRQTGDYGGVECVDRGTWTPPSASHSVYFHLLIHFCFYVAYLSIRYGLWCPNSRIQCFAVFLWSADGLFFHVWSHKCKISAFRCTTNIVSWANIIHFEDYEISNNRKLD